MIREIVKLKEVKLDKTRCGISECIYCLTSVGVTIMTSTLSYSFLFYTRALRLPTKLAPYRSDTVYPAGLSKESLNLFVRVVKELDLKSNGLARTGSNPVADVLLLWSFLVVVPDLGWSSFYYNKVKSHYTAVNAQEDITAHKEVLRLTIFRFYGFIKIMSDIIMAGIILKIVNLVTRI
ncbi:hypothetical protein PHYBLDRAFT_165674 [Phycomyces blakesleeanus NRRL 1555(-)]|uniref:Uncharacterized protein n=1 Tax=Phycomyces blakesleeanus (strain ATCC 8743b / DSM 1359 / FGSC 10004 / NBRC 33097 / NRRL 1555) TaxID=763407 RepID=A0A162XY12_PHYB8|nr:hypothetical protein PHYBLDRAFT_165674 [Phycomyces blakesleeanus NRRL 1555(-)]OAD77185.1 hypothetical protein PHYBLDRAFT_165674 [Phycomyces blakesleeanus NRRL 1555(-)]|eukprot:XP_018295225.1 hypothetical protein PHYBLDRAFT_165674 [Phycomyces blakesleeanus NRRL 1555(-)]